MDYKLAKELKKAGYPQGKSEHYYIDQKITTGIISEYDESFMEDREVDCPTLSELIDACGNMFAVLEQWGSFDRYVEGNPKWCAFGHEKRTFGGGSTPEEAVAKLWLELNK